MLSDLRYRLRAIFRRGSMERDLARELQSLDVEVVATDGTREALAAEGIAVAPFVA